MTSSPLFRPFSSSHSLGTATKTDVPDVNNFLNILKNSRECSINQIADELKIQWKTAIKVLEFLKENGLVKERKGKKTYKEERLFSLK